MKKQIHLTLSAIFIFIVHCSLAQDPCLEKLSWLKGTWKMQGKESVLMEEWGNSSTGVLHGKSYEVKGADTVVTENTTISCIAGRQVFTYYPVLKGIGDNRKPVNFVLTSGDNNTFVFENKEHDFPQRIVYRLENENECHAWIEGPVNGQTSRIDFHYHRSE